MTDEESGHARYAELAAAHALHALEPADEARFLQHAGQCDSCRQALAGYADVTAALTDLAAPAEPSPRLRLRIMAAAAREQVPAPGRSAEPPAADLGKPPEQAWPGDERRPRRPAG